MKTLFIFSFLIGAPIGIFLGMPPKEPKIIRADEFWRVNGTCTNEGELFEVFYPPLEKTLDIE
jgi:hypothetical protein